MATLALPDERPADRPARRGKACRPWQRWGLILLAPYALVFVIFVVYPVGYGLWLARHPASYEKLFDDPIFLRSVFNTLAFLIIAINLKMMVALILSGFFVVARTWIKWLSLLFILPWAVPSIPTILSIRFMLNPEWGLINSLIFRFTGADGPNWLNDPYLALAHRDARPHLEVAAVLDADPDRRAARHSRPSTTRPRRSTAPPSWQKFRFITWPSMRTLYLTCTILSMIFTMGDFNSVYLLTGGGPADLTHVLATLGIRYLRLDEVDMSMAAIVIALPAVLPLVYFMMKRLSK